MVRLVSENTDKDIAIARAREQIEDALVDLAANILRVVRGAGRPYELGEQAASFVAALDAHWAAAGCGPSSEELGGMIDYSRPDHLVGKFPEDEVGLKFAEHTAIRGALQVVASRLLEQRTQETAGSSEFYTGLNEIIRRREIRHQNWAQQKQKGFTDRPAARKASAKPASTTGKKKPTG